MSKFTDTKRNVSFSGREQVFDSSLTGGPFAENYERYVRNVFKPANLATLTENSTLKASTILRLHDLFGSSSMLDETKDSNFGEGKLDRMLIEMGLSDMGCKGRQTYLGSRRVELDAYFPNRINCIQPHSASIDFSDTYSSRRKKEEENWRKTNKQIIFNSRDSESSPVSPYLYNDYPYVQRQDSRIVCSNFIQITTRPRDRFLEKIDRTLAEVRAMPRFT